MSEALGRLAGGVEDHLYSHSDYFANAVAWLKTYWVRPTGRADGGRNLPYFPWPPPGVEGLDDHERENRDLALFQRANALTPTQVVYALAALREVYCRGVSPLVAFNSRGTDWRAPGWYAAVQRVREFGDFTLPWFTTLLSRLGGVLSGPPPAGVLLDWLAAEVRALSAAAKTRDDQGFNPVEWQEKLGALWDEARLARLPDGDPVPDRPVKVTTLADVRGALQVLIDWLDRELARAAGGEPPPNLGTTPNSESAGPPLDATVSDDPREPTSTFMSSAELAVQLGVPGRANAVDVALRQYAERNSDCRENVTNPRKGEPRVIYRVKAVWPFLLERLPRWQTRR